MQKNTKKHNAISVKNLTVQFGDLEVLKDISFDIQEGEITAILGPNGSGKSTLMRCILGLQEYKGTIEVLGGRVENAYENIGYLPQRFTFDREFPITVREFMELALKKGVDKRMIEDTLHEVGMIAVIDKRLGELSGGQLQRVLIARALINNPKILILDEPEAGIDIEAERNFYNIIKHLDETHNITIVIISHEVELVYDFAEKVICLNKQLVCHGVPSQVLTKDKLEEMYGGGLGHHQHHH
jgi:ABC-type Mn2+/Zn2+ transport system ATPase subunit